MKLIALSLCLFIISGCATTDWNTFWYSNPKGQQYGLICKKCNRIMTITVDQFAYENIICPFCGQSQNLQLARNQYLYYEQQQQQANLQNFAQSMREINQATYQNQQNIINSYLNRHNASPQNYYQSPKSSSGCVWEWDCSSYPCKQVPICASALDIVPPKTPSIAPIPPPSIKPIKIPSIPPIGTSKCEQKYICNNYGCEWQEVCQ